MNGETLIPTPPLITKMERLRDRRKVNPDKPSTPPTNIANEPKLKDLLPSPPSSAGGLLNKRHNRPSGVNVANPSANDSNVLLTPDVDDVHLPFEPFQVNNTYNQPSNNKLNSYNKATNKKSNVFSDNKSKVRSNATVDQDNNRSYSADFVENLNSTNTPSVQFPDTPDLFGKDRRDPFMHSKPAQRYQKMANSKYHKQIRAKNREFNPVITRRSPNDTPLPSDSQFVPGYHGLNVSDPSEHVVNPFKLSPVTSPVVDSKRSPVGNGKRDSLTPDKILFSTTVNATRTGGFFPSIPGAPLLAPLEDAVGPVVVDQIRYDEGVGKSYKIRQHLRELQVRFPFHGCW